MKPGFLIACLTLLAALAACQKPAASQTGVIAHRGYWKTEGSAQNSIAALMKADSIGAWGSECDVYLCGDDVLMVNHDHRMFLDGDTLLMEESPSSLLRQITLENGEPMPTFEAYLDAFENCRHTRLIIELKSHNLPEARQKQLAAQAVSMVAEKGLRERVEYIAFSRTVAEEIIRLDPRAKVAYLNGDLAPAELKALGYTGLDYHIGVMRSNEAWFAEAHDLGLEVNVWTVNDEADMRYMIDRGADYITTDEPVLLQEVLRTPPAR